MKIFDDQQDSEDESSLTNDSPNKRKAEYQIVSDDFKRNFPSPLKDANKIATDSRFDGQIFHATLSGSSDIRYMFIVPYNQGVTLNFCLIELTKFKVTP